MKRSWLTTIKTNEGVLLPCTFVVISLLHFSSFLCILFIIAAYPAKDGKAQCKLQKDFWFEAWFWLGHLCLWPFWNFQNFGKMAADKKHFESKFCLFMPFLKICQLSQRQTLQAWFKGWFQGLTRLLNSCSSHSEIPKSHSVFNEQSL